MKYVEFKWFLLFLTLVISLGCEKTDSDESKTPEVKLGTPTLEIDSLSAKEVWLKWDKIEGADSYQINTYLVSKSGATIDAGTMAIIPGNESQFDFPIYDCGDSMRVTIIASKNVNGNVISSEFDTAAFMIPACEYSLTPLTTTLPAYCGGAVDKFKVLVKNLTYNQPYDWRDGANSDLDGEDDLLINVTSSLGQVSLSLNNGGYHTIEPPFVSPSLCDNNPATGKITFQLTVQDKNTGKDIPGSPLNLEAFIN